VTGQSTAYQFKGNGELTIVSKSQVLDKSSKTTTNMVPFAPVTCS
jgi:hypothetical protein